MTSNPTSTTAQPVWLHCSPARTVWRQGEIVQKVYVSGSMTLAEHEHAMGTFAAGEGVVRYVTAGTDEASGRPTVNLAFEPGRNLAACVGTDGALPALDALQRLEPVAATLARLHALRTPELPNGMCHGDIKPQNLLLTSNDTLLLDFEHAQAIGGTHGGGFTGGTCAYSPPEAHHGAAPDAAFDVYGFGATLAFALGSCPQHAHVTRLIAACMASDPTARPTAEELWKRCRELRQQLANDADEATLHDWASGAMQCTPLTNATDCDDRRIATWHLRQRLLDRLPGLLDHPDAVANEPAELHSQLHHNERVLARFPRHAPSLTRRSVLLHATGLMLASAAELVHDRRKQERFDDAADWLTAITALATFAMELPHGLARITQIGTNQPPAPLHRTPIEFLHRLQQQLTAERAELLARCEQVDLAERELDLTRTDELVDELAADYGGTSPTVSHRRDQLHRLAFYLDRVARSDANVERVGPLWDPVALQPLQQLVADAAKATESRIRRDGGAVGLRSLELTLANLREEFAHLDRVPAALDALTQALRHLTQQAWQQLAEAEQQLRMVPVPVRPLQIVLGRLDTFRTLEAFVDLPRQPRSELLDGLERLRLGLDQARSARDRLAENAEHALARGHWTTGLFDMERAVADLQPGDDHERLEAERLRERLQAARRTKQEIETAVRRNVELTARYTALEDDAKSTSTQRLRVLEERRDCLIFLGMHVPNERAELYRNDLRSVETIIAIEQAAVAEQQLDATTEPGARLRLTRDTLDTLEQLTTTTHSNEHDREPSGRMVRLLEHWQNLTRQCQRTVDEELAERQHQQQQRRRMIALAVLALVVTTTAIGIAIKPWLFGQPVEARGK